MPKLPKLPYAYTLMFIEGVGGDTWDECLAGRKFAADYFESQQRLGAVSKLECSCEETELDLPGEKRRAAVLKAKASLRGWSVEEVATKVRVFTEFDIGWGRWVYGPDGDMWLRHVPVYLYEDPRTMRKAIEDGWAEHALREQIERGGGLLNGDGPGTPASLRTTSASVLSLDGSNMDLRSSSAPPSGGSALVSALTPPEKSGSLATPSLIASDDAWKQWAVMSTAECPTSLWTRSGDMPEFTAMDTNACLSEWNPHVSDRRPCPSLEHVFIPHSTKSSLMRLLSFPDAYPSAFSSDTYSPVLGSPASILARTGWSGISTMPVCLFVFSGTTLTTPAAKSTLDHLRRAQSPMRRPVYTPSAIIRNAPGSFWALDASAAISWTVSARRPAALDPRRFFIPSHAEGQADAWASSAFHVRRRNVRAPFHVVGDRRRAVSSRKRTANSWFSSEIR